MFRIQNLQEYLMVQIDFDCKLTYFDFDICCLQNSRESTKPRVLSSPQKDYDYW